MTGFDYFLAALFVISIVIEMKRGFGPAIFDLLAFYSALLFTSVATPAIVRSFPTIGTSGEGYANCQITTFIILSILGLIIARFASGAIQINLGMFDNLGGMLAGGLCAMVFCHGLVIGLSVGGDQQVSTISGTFSQQMLTFSDYYQFLDGINSSLATRQAAS
jgi:uncharacterized membrane protein required for colicin V production